MLVLVLALTPKRLPHRAKYGTTPLTSCVTSLTRTLTLLLFPLLSQAVPSPKLSTIKRRGGKRSVAFSLSPATSLGLPTDTPPVGVASRVGRAARATAGQATAPRRQQHTPSTSTPFGSASDDEFALDFNVADDKPPGASGGSLLFGQRSPDDSGFAPDDFDDDVGTPPASPARPSPAVVLAAAAAAAAATAPADAIGARRRPSFPASVKRRSTNAAKPRGSPASLPDSCGTPSSGLSDHWDRGLMTPPDGLEDGLPLNMAPLNVSRRSDKSGVSLDVSRRTDNSQGGSKKEAQHKKKRRRQKAPVEDAADLDWTEVSGRDVCLFVRLSGCPSVCMGGVFRNVLLTGDCVRGFSLGGGQRDPWSAHVQEQLVKVDQYELAIE